MILVTSRVARGAARAALLTLAAASALGAQSPTYGTIGLVQTMSGGACVQGAPIPILPTQCPPVDGVSTLTVGPATATFETSASVGGPLRAASTIRVDGGTGATYSAFARAGYYDQFTVTGAGPARARFTFTMDGIGGMTGTDQYPSGYPGGPAYGVLIILNYGAQDVASTFANVGVPGALAQSMQFVAPGDGLTRTQTLDVPLVGSVNNLLFWFAAVVGVSRPSMVAPGAAWSASGYSDFLRTLTLDDVDVVDAAGNVLDGPGVSITSASGTLSSVPEPAPLALVGGGLAALALGTRRRRRA